MVKHDSHDEKDDGYDADAEFLSYLDPYSNTMSIDDGDRFIVDVTKFFDAITEQLERVDMDNEPIGLLDVADQDVWFSLINSGWSEQICRHLAAVTADIVHTRYPAAAAMRLDERFYLTAASLDPPFEWSYPGEHLNIAIQIMAEYLRGEPDDLPEIDYTAGDSEEPFTPLYKTVKSMFELSIAVIGLAKTHPLYHTDKT